MFILNQKFIASSLLLIPIALAGASLESRQACPAQPLVISVIENEQTNAIATKIMSEVYRRVGCEVEFKFLPAKRALHDAAIGNTDGDVARIGGTEKKYPDLMPVPTPILHFKGMAFGLESLPRKITDWKSLEGLRIGVLRGVQYSAIGTTGMNTIGANSMSQLFRLLKHNRVQVVISAFGAGTIELNRNWADSGIKPTGKPLIVAPLFHYLNRRHYTLVLRLDSVMQQMQKSGELENLFSQSIQELSKKTKPFESRSEE